MTVRPGAARRAATPCSGALAVKGALSTDALHSGSAKPFKRQPASVAAGARRAGLCECAMRKRISNTKWSDDPVRLVRSLQERVPGGRRLARRGSLRKAQPITAWCWRFRIVGW